MDMEVEDKMVAPEFQLFQAYRQKAAALRGATQDTLDVFSNVGNFSSANEYLLKRAGISNRLQDRLKRGDKQIKPLLQSLIKELNAEIKELDSMLSSISVFGGDVFRNFQQSAISHQKVQADILSELYELGVDHLHAIEEQIHARTTSVEQAHHRFREKLEEILIAIVNRSDKALFIDTWIDCMEFLILYIRDDMELALPRHTYIELIEQESYGPAQTVLSKYFTAGAGEHYIEKFEKAGIKRRVREDDRNKDKYVNLDADKQKEVDKVVKESLLKLLEGVEFEHPNTRQRFTWDQEENGNSIGIKQIIKDVIFKENKVTKETVTIIEKLLIEFRTRIIELKAKKYFRFESESQNLGYNKFIIFVTDDGHPVKVENLRDETWRENNVTTVLAVKDFLKRVLDSGTKEPEKDPFIKSLLQIKQNIDLLSSSENSSSGNGEDEEWFEGVEAISAQNLLSQIPGIKTHMETMLSETYWENSTLKQNTDFNEQIRELRNDLQIIAKTLKSREPLSSSKHLISNFKEHYEKLGRSFSYEQLKDNCENIERDLNKIIENHGG